MQVDSDIPPLGTLLEEALVFAQNVSSSVGLLSDLYGEIGVSRQDSDARNLARMLDMIHAEAERVGGIIEQARLQSLTTPSGKPSPARAPHPRRTASIRQ